ncbi:MAG: sulfotransferase domain-containing protein [Sedimenticola sp.]
MMTDSPVFVSSVFKSGTWLLREIVRQLTNKAPIEPDLSTRKTTPYDIENIVIPSVNEFYSWHFIPTREVMQAIDEHDGKCIFLIRNIYDLVVSIFYHFSLNVDQDIGKGANKDKFFSMFTKSKGMEIIINGNDSSDFKWSGIELHLEHIEKIISNSERSNVHITTFERLTNNKMKEVTEISKFLGIDREAEELKSIVDSTEFRKMKSQAVLDNKGSHFRKGESGSHRYELGQDHYQLIDKIIEDHFPGLKALADEAGFDETFIK